MKLLIDAGNTRLKWRLVEQGQCRSAGVLSHNEIDTRAWRALPAPDAVFGCCVADESVRSAVETVCLELWRIMPGWLRVTAEAGGLSNAYDIATLGPDRWASAVAAYQLAGGAALAVNAGTAITVDAIDARGRYLGGTILPGLFLLRQALARNTARLPLAEGHVASFPTTTVDAIQTGAVDAACGAIERLYGRLGQEANIYLSGGDAERLLSHLLLPARWVDNLVLDGLQVLNP